MDGWSSKLIGCRRLLTKGLSKAKGAVRAGLQCVLLQYNWDVMIGRALLRGLQPSASLVELKCIDKGETVPQWTAKSPGRPNRLTVCPSGPKTWLQSR